MADPDNYESADPTTTSTGSFPNDTSTSGKHYQVAIPDYMPGHTPQLNSYFRHGVPHSSASSYDEHASPPWSQNGSSHSLGDDLLSGISPPDQFQSSLGGVRDHTDGNRLVTTREDVIEVIGGQYRQLILANQPPPTDADPDWVAPSSSNENVEEPSIVTHEYTNWFYEVISTTSQPGSGSFAEPRMKVDAAQSAGYDYYEYANANNFIDIMAGRSNLIEKMYAGRMLEVMSTVHASHSDWEGTIGELSDGDLKEYMLGKNITEVIKAEWNIEERIEAHQGGISELMLAAGGVNEITTAGGAINEMTTAGGAIHEMTAAGGLISEETLAGGLIHELTAAGGAIFEETLAGGFINEVTAAIGDVNEFSLSNGVLTDIMYGNVSFIDVMAASQILVEVITGALVLEITSARTSIDCTFGSKVEWSEQEAHVCESYEELMEMEEALVMSSTKLGSAQTRIMASIEHIAGEYQVV